jgi:hypothetical protein
MARVTVWFNAEDKKAYDKLKRTEKFPQFVKNAFYDKLAEVKEKNKR